MRPSDYLGDIPLIIESIVTSLIYGLQSAVINSMIALLVAGGYQLITKNRPEYGKVVRWVFGISFAATFIVALVG